MLRSIQCHLTGQTIRDPASWYGLLNAIFLRGNYLNVLTKIRLLINLEVMLDRLALVLITISMCASSSLSQSIPRRENAPATLWVVASSKDSVTVSFAYAVPFSRIIFTKNNAPARGFNATLTFSVDATDSLSGTNYHKFHEKKISADSFSETQSSRLFAEDLSTITIPKSVYKIATEVRDDGQQITYLSHSDRKTFGYSGRSAIFSEVAEKTGGKPAILSTIFLDSVSSPRVFPELYDNVAQFPKGINVAVLTEDSGSTPLTLTLETKTGVIISKLDSISPLKAVLETNDSTVSFREIQDSAHSLYIADFKVDTLQEGSYELETSLKGEVEKFPFSYEWVDKPFTLRDLDMALSLLKYIVPDSVFSLINSGNEKEKWEKFDECWESRDPTPKTAFNELEAEFYERADYAFDHFRTVGTNNGATTDRGKAYILFGKPANVKREFRPDGTYEIWYYPNQKKSLVFKEQGYGEFKLYRTENL